VVGSGDLGVTSGGEWWRNHSEGREEIPSERTSSNVEELEDIMYTRTYQESKFSA